MGRKLLGEIVFIFREVDDAKEFLKIPFVRKNMDVSEHFKGYLLIRDEISFMAKREYYFDHEFAENSILDLDILMQNEYSVVFPYISFPNIRDQYITKYGIEYFRFESSESGKSYDMLEGFRDCREDTSQKVVIFHLKTFMASQLHKALSLILAQDFLLREISSELIFHAGNADDFISVVKENDNKYKQSILNVCFSLVRLGIDLVHAGEIIDICVELSHLAESPEFIQDKLGKIVGSIQDIVAFNTQQALIESEERLVSHNTRGIDREWASYRANVYKKSYDAFHTLWDKCIDSNDFVSCIIKQAIILKKESSDNLLLDSSEIAKLYIKNILQPLYDQIEKISIIRDSIKSQKGSCIIQLYFRRMHLIDFALSHEHSTSCLGRWLSKSMGHQLTRYFPELVFQKKLSPIWIYRFMGRKVKYAGEKITAKEYFIRKRMAECVLGTFFTSHFIKNKLYESLEDLMSQYSDQLIADLQKPEDHIPSEYEINIMSSENEKDSLRCGRYNFKRPVLSLFDNSSKPRSHMYLP